jgi:Cytochrome c/c1 heme lyase
LRSTVGADAHTNTHTLTPLPHCDHAQQVEETAEDDMDMVVAVHNNMNEKTWRQIQMWEDVDGKDPGDGTGPRLLHFEVRVDTYQAHAFILPCRHLGACTIGRSWRGVSVCVSHRHLGNHCSA